MPTFCRLVKINVLRHSFHSFLVSGKIVTNKARSLHVVERWIAFNHPWFMEEETGPAHQATVPKTVIGLTDPI